MYDENKTFEFVIYKENFLSDKECDELIKTLDTEELTDGELVGDYEDNVVNKNVRQTLNIDFNQYETLLSSILIYNISIS